MHATHAGATITRCAIYTRKSTEQGLDREVNSLEAQRETCSAYIRAQRYRGWAELPRRYDDGGESGAHLTRPALQALLGEIEAGRVDVVVIYKIDRLTRSLLDFVRLVDMFERYDVSFVSVTQAFDTSDSMGRLVLNVLLTFAQFERELMGDRLRDKFAALRRRGKFIGGNVPLGYDLEGGRLVVNEREAATVRMIFDRYPNAPTGNHLLKELRAEGVRSKERTTLAGKRVGGGLLSPGTLAKLLRNPLYLGYVSYKGTWHQGEHAAIVQRDQWDLVQAQIKRREGRQIPRDPSRNFLLGLAYDAFGRRMRLSSKWIQGRCYRYYCSEASSWARRKGIKRLWATADEAEELVLSALRAHFADCRALAASLAWRAAEEPPVRLRDQGEAAARRIERMDRRRQRHLVHALVDRIAIDRDHLRLHVSVHELSRLLAWDGVGTFRRGATRPRQGASPPFVMTIPCSIVREHRFFSVPVRPKDGAAPSRVNPALVRLLEEAEAAQRTVLDNRERSVEDLARERRIGPSFYARLIRLNYLAPDIKAAIVDGRQPAGLTRKRLAFCSLPLDWALQRELLGFERQIEQGPQQASTIPALAAPDRVRIKAEPDHSG